MFSIHFVFIRSSKAFIENLFNESIITCIDHHVKEEDTLKRTLAHYSPFSCSHHVIVELFIQVIQQALCLDNHRVNFVRREL